MEDSDSVWIKTLRERTHRLTTVTAALEMQVGLLSKRAEELSEEVRRMATADEIAQGVADELRRRDRGHREKIDASMKRTMWVIGTLLAVFQLVVAAAVVFHH